MKTVLVADDVPSLRQLVRDTLEPEGYVVLEARDGIEAWKLTVRECPDIVLLDIGMPGPSGLILAAAIKAEPALAAIRVVMLTSLSDREDRAIGLAVGADEYVGKPFSPMGLLALLDSMIPTVS